MTKKEICLNNETIAYYSGLNGIEIKKIEYGINDYIYCVAGAWCSSKTYHKLMIKETLNGEPFIMLHGYRIKLSECLRV